MAIKHTRAITAFNECAVPLMSPTHILQIHIMIDNTHIFNQNFYQNLSKFIFICFFTFFLHRQEGHTPYTLTAGGATSVGAWGYIEAWREMMEQVAKYSQE